MCILSLVSFVFLAFSSFGSVPAAAHSKLDRMGLLVRQWPKTHHQGNKGAAKEEAHWGHGVARLRHTDNLCRELKLGEFLYGAVSLMTKNMSSYRLWLFYKIEWWQIHVNTGSSKSSYQSAKTTLETSATDPFITWLKSVCCEAEKKKWGVTPEFSTLLYVYTYTQNHASRSVPAQLNNRLFLTLALCSLCPDSGTKPASLHVLFIKHNNEFRIEKRTH